MLLIRVLWFCLPGWQLLFENQNEHSSDGEEALASINHGKEQNQKAIRAS